MLRVIRNRKGSVTIMAALVVGAVITVMGAGAGMAVNKVGATAKQEAAKTSAGDGLVYAQEATTALIKSGALVPSQSNPNDWVWFQAGPVPTNLAAAPSGSPLTLNFQVCDAPLMTTSDTNALFASGAVPNGANCLAKNLASAPVVKIQTVATASGNVVRMQAFDTTTPSERAPAGVAPKRVSVAGTVQTSAATSTTLFTTKPDCKLVVAPNPNDYYAGQTAVLMHTEYWGAPTDPSPLPGPAAQAVVSTTNATHQVYQTMSEQTAVVGPTTVNIALPGSVPAQAQTLADTNAAFYDNTIVDTISGVGGSKVCTVPLKVWAPPSCNIQNVPPSGASGIVVAPRFVKTGNYDVSAFTVSSGGLTLPIANQQALPLLGPATYTFTGLARLTAAAKPTGALPADATCSASITVAAPIVIPPPPPPPPPVSNNPPPPPPPVVCTVGCTPPPPVVTPPPPSCILYSTGCGGGACGSSDVENVWLWIPTNKYITYEECHEVMNHEECCYLAADQLQVKNENLHNHPQKHWGRGQSANCDIGPIDADISTFLSEGNRNYAGPDGNTYRMFTGGTPTGKKNKTSPKNYGSPECPVLALTYSPLIIDFSGQGIGLDEENSVSFDIAGTGTKIPLAWPKNPQTTMWLALPTPEGNIDGIHQLFGNNTVGPDKQKASNGFAALKKYDANHDGVIDAKDPIFKRLRLWADLNHDGKVDPGELFTLAEKGVSSIDLDAMNYNEQLDYHGNQTMQRSVADMADGSFRLIFDLWLTAN